MFARFPYFFQKKSLQREQFQIKKKEGGYFFYIF